MRNVHITQGATVKLLVRIGIRDFPINVHRRMKSCRWYVLKTKFSIRIRRSNRRIVSKMGMGIYSTRIGASYRIVGIVDEPDGEVQLGRRIERERQGKCRRGKVRSLLRVIKMRSENLDYRVFRTFGLGTRAETEPWLTHPSGKIRISSLRKVAIDGRNAR